MGETFAENTISNVSMNNDGTITLTASSGDTSTITIDPSVLTTSTNYYASTLSSNTATTSTGYYYNNGNSYTYSTNIDPWGPVEEKDPIKEAVEERLREVLDEDEEMMPLVKNYLRKYLERVLEAPEEIVNDLLKKEEEIQKQKDEINDLKKQVEDLRRSITILELDKYSRDSGPGKPIGIDPWSPYGTTDWGSSTSTCSGLGSNIYTTSTINDLTAYVNNNLNSTSKNDTSTIA